MRTTRATHRSRAALATTQLSTYMRKKTFLLSIKVYICVNFLHGPCGVIPQKCIEVSTSWKRAVAGGVRGGADAASRSTSRLALICISWTSMTDDPEKLQSFPAGLLRNNYVVDLTIRPGRLLPCGTRAARLVCGPVCAPPYTARNMPDVCRCPP
ncbi:unnamed protein product [Chrysodeixis includens]|uniref:Uncharacterized protein n=1 Tax=Chrysodeixis includens TaxID=689277 RepID=A0A9N8KTU8_CHRIL|nr:unnamed protein product [Chrysodeixis includens]